MSNESDQSGVTLYGTGLCPFCMRARALLEQKGVAFTDIDVSDSADRRAMTDKAGGDHRVPQIFIGSLHVGGCDELMALERDGELDRLLGGEQPNA